jgi:hypothetical protein
VILRVFSYERSSGRAAISHQPSAISLKLRSIFSAENHLAEQLADG